MSFKASGVAVSVALVSTLLSPFGAIAEPAESLSGPVSASSVTPDSVPERPGTATGFACWELQELDEGRFICDGYTFEFDDDGSLQILAWPFVSSEYDQPQTKSSVTE